MRWEAISTLAMGTTLLSGCSLLTNLGDLSNPDAAAPHDASADASADGNLSPDALGSRKRIFYTSGTYQGTALGGISGADAKCGLASKARSLGGTFVAWISDSKTDAQTRITDVGPWYSLDRKTLLFSNKAALLYLPVNGIVEDDTGTAHASLCYWTGTDLGGVKTTLTCADWGTADAAAPFYGSFGLVGSVDNRWTNDNDGTYPCWVGGNSYGQKDCGDSYAVLCIEQ